MEQENGYKDWDIISQSGPNYWYWRNGNNFLESRVKYQKHKLINLLENFDENLTEIQNMKNNGYNRIFDCRKLKTKT